MDKDTAEAGSSPLAEERAEDMGKDTEWIKGVLDPLYAVFARSWTSVARLACSQYVTSLVCGDPLCGLCATLVVLLFLLRPSFRFAALPFALCEFAVPLHSVAIVSVGWCIPLFPRQTSFLNFVWVGVKTTTAPVLMSKSAGCNDVDTPMTDLFWVFSSFINGTTEQISSDFLFHSPPPLVFTSAKP